VEEAFVENLNQYLYSMEKSPEFDDIPITPFPMPEMTPIDRQESVQC
jgi:hypothetical protein